LLYCAIGLTKGRNAIGLAKRRNKAIAPYDRFLPAEIAKWVKPIRASGLSMDWSRICTGR
jgi:hypothetical protein